MKIVKAVLVLSAAGLQALGGASPSAAQGVAPDAAYVESVTGRVVASVQGKPVLLDVLDTIGERTRLDVLANSELRICHYQGPRIVTLTGPLRAVVSLSAVTAENGKPVEASPEACAKPVVSTFQGGFLARSAVAPTKVALRPNIKIVNRTANGIRTIALWDGARQKIVATFKRNAARPVLDDGQSYQLVVGRNDGSELKMVLQASTMANTGPLILVIR